MIPKNFVEEITRKTKIESVVAEYIDLTLVGAQLRGICPFCKNSGFSVSTNKKIYKCFKCGKGGGVIAFIQEIDKVCFPEAITLLAQKFDLVVPNTDTI
ncbi:DNA primase [compost metagenome]|jgi:DNA primase